jgi:hypothetical protein
MWKNKKNIPKRMGFITDQKGILRRYIREREHWESHLMNCHKFIVDNMNNQKFSNIAFLGSGWWLDIPVEQVINNFSRVFMVDIFHPRQIKHRAAKIDNLELIEYDITGGVIEEVYQKVREKKKLSVSLNITSVPELNFSGNTLIVSINILNQLDNLIVEWIQSKLGPNIESTPMQHQIQLNHINFIQENKGILISDVEEINRDPKGSLVSSRSLVFPEFPDALIHKEWVWKFDTHGLYREGLLTNFTVKAVRFE